MAVRQTLHEIGLEQGTIAVWSEPLSGKLLKPKYGKSPFPWKLLVAVCMIIGSASFCASLARDINQTLLAFIAFVFVFSLGVPILNFLDRKAARNVWIYPDKVLITQQSDRKMIKKSSVNKIYIYKISSGKEKAIEFVSQSGVSHVVGLPDDISLAHLTELTDVLEKYGYRIANPNLAL